MLKVAWRIFTPIHCLICLFGMSFWFRYCHWCSHEFWQSYFGTGGPDRRSFWTAVPMLWKSIKCHLPCFQVTILGWVLKNWKIELFELGMKGDPLELVSPNPFISKVSWLFDIFKQTLLLSTSLLPTLLLLNLW